MGFPMSTSPLTDGEAFTVADPEFDFKTQQIAWSKMRMALDAMQRAMPLETSLVQTAAATSYSIEQVHKAGGWLAQAAYLLSLTRDKLQMVELGCKTVTLGHPNVIERTAAQISAKKGGA